MLALGGPVQAFAATVGASADATIVRPLTLTKTEDLDFGTVAAGAFPGTVVVNPATGARTVTGGVTAAGGTPRRAEFVGQAAIGLLALVSIGPSPVLDNGSGSTMGTALAVEGGTGIRVLPGTGIQTFRVGGTLAVGALQPGGLYTGQFTFTVNYL